MIWYAWYPVRLENRRWAWLRNVWAQLEVSPSDTAYAPERWVYYPLYDDERIPR